MEANRFVADLQVLADELAGPPAGSSGRTKDPDDEFLVALAGVEGVNALISGDPHLLDLQGIDVPVVTPAAFLDRLTPDE